MVQMSRVSFVFLENLEVPMSMKLSCRALVVCAGLVAFTGCGFGGSNSKLSPGKIQAARKVALVSVCLQKEMGAVKGTKNFGAFDGNGARMMLAPIVETLNAALGTEWKGVQFTPLAPSAELSGRPVGEHRVCMNDVDGMTPGGFMGDPDLAYLGGLASKLGVDAVLTMSGNPIIRHWDGKGAKAYVASVGSGVQLHLVDRSGEEIAYVELRDFETEYNLVPGTTDTADATKIGQSLGHLIGVGVAATVQGRKFEPPSRPGISGL
jgi:hypothetical protein